MSEQATPPAPRKTLASELAWLGVVLLVFAGAYLRVPPNVHYDFNMDEYMVLDMSEGDTPAAIWHLAQYQVHPPFFYVLLHYWIAVSHDPAIVRVFPLLIGLTLIPLYYLIGLRIAGRLCGLATASLMTVSHGCIMQSYAVRQYGLLVLLLSLSFYLYLGWRGTRARSALAGYTGFGLLAGLTHFSAIFFYFCLAVPEAVALICKRDKWRTLAEWLAANFVIAAFAFFIYRCWQVSVTAHAFYFRYFHAFPTSIAEIRQNAWNAPFAAVGYAYPTFPILTVLAVFAFLPKVRGRTALLPYLVQTGFACLVSMGIYFSAIYTTTGARQNLWMVPFIFPVTGGVIAFSLHTERGIRKKAVVILAIVLGFGFFTALSERTADRGELGNWTPAQKQGAIDFLHQLGTRDLVYMVSLEALQYTNVYRDYPVDALEKKRMAALVPYSNTRILSNPYFENDFNREVLLATLKEAYDEHMFDGIDRVAFVQASWRGPALDLLLCKALPKTITSIPPLPADRPLKRSNITGLTIMVVTKQALVDEVIAPDGHARACLDGKHDMLPGFAFPAHP